MMQKGFKPPVRCEILEFCSTTVTIYYRRNSLPQNPINKGENRQAKPIGNRNQNYGNKDNQATEKLIKSFGKIKLAAIAYRTIIKNVIRILKLPPRM